MSVKSPQKRRMPGRSGDGPKLNFALTVAGIIMTISVFTWYGTFSGYITFTNIEWEFLFNVIFPLIGGAFVAAILIALSRKK